MKTIQIAMALHVQILKLVTVLITLLLLSNTNYLKDGK